MFKATALILLSFVVLFVVAPMPLRAADVDDKKKADPVVAGNNALACDLYGQLREQQGNLFFSPYSISSALAMTYAGARGDTAAEMAKTLHFGPNDAGFHAAFGQVAEALNAAGKKGEYQLSIANAIWVQQGHWVQADFTKVIKTNYHGSLYGLDFKTDAEAARRTVNSWVEDQTNNKIKDLLQSGVLKKDTRLVLTNAIYFKSRWAMTFNEDDTKPGPFTRGDGRRVEVPMMHMSAYYAYFRGDGFQAVSLPYAHDSLSMIVLLPDKIDSLPEIEKKMARDMLAGVRAKYEEAEVVLTLPKFKVTSEFRLKPTLSSLGMKEAFSEAADFSGIDGRKDLVLDDVIHKAFVDVHEKGTEAAAATAVRPPYADGDSETHKHKKVTFRVDHPFVFLICDNETVAILFLGRIVDPSGK